VEEKIQETRDERRETRDEETEASHSNKQVGAVSNVWNLKLEPVRVKEPGRQPWKARQRKAKQKTSYKVRSVTVKAFCCPLTCKLIVIIVLCLSVSSVGVRCFSQSRVDALMAAVWTSIDTPLIHSHRIRLQLLVARS